MIKMEYTFTNIDNSIPVGRADTHRNQPKPAAPSANKTQRKAAPQEKIIEMEKGYLIVETRDERTNKIISNAYVVILSAYDDRILYSLLTGADGRTDAIALLAPARKYSLDVKSIIVPYSNYAIQVEYDGHSTNIYRGVQIFADTTTIEICHLTRLPENLDLRNQYVLPPHKLTPIQEI